MKEDYTDAVRTNFVLRSILEAAYLRLINAKNTAEIAITEGIAEGMAIATAYLDDSPFIDTSEAVTFLWWLHDNPEKAQPLLYPRFRK